MFFNGIRPNKRLEFNVKNALSHEVEVCESQIEAFPRLPSTFSLLGIVVPMYPTTLNQGLKIKNVQIVTF